jgi:VWFA-related protein
MRLALGLASCGLLTVALVSASHQTPQPKFRAGVDVVGLDVSVLDKNRQPIHGLTAADFTIRENSKPQQVVEFKAIDVPDDPPMRITTPWMREVAPDVRRNDEIRDPRIFIIVMDDAMAPPDAWILEATRKVAREVIGKLGPADLAAVTFTNTAAGAQELTTDHARLLAAVEKFSAGPHQILVQQTFEVAEEIHFLAPLRTLQGVAEALIDAPQSRKVLVYISSGIPVDFSEAARKHLISGASGLIATMAVPEMQNRMIQGMKEVFTQARLANINVYCIDSGGLGGLDGYLARKKAEYDVEPPPKIFIYPAYEQGVNYRDFTQTLASNTGGLAVINTDDFSSGIAQMFKENGSYYLIGYQSTDTRKDGSYRRIEVQVNRPGAIVRAKSGYTVEKALSGDKATAAAAAKAEPWRALAGAVPAADIGLQVATATFASTSWREPRTAAVAVLLGLRHDVGAAGAGIGAMDLVFDVFTPLQKLQMTQSLHLAPTAADGKTSAVAYEFGTELNLAPGRYTLRVAARRASDGKSGSVYTDLDVPDFTERRVVLSGAVLTASPGVPNPAPTRLQALMPVVPTSLRDFRTTDVVGAFVRAYNRAAVAFTNGQLDVTILDQHGGVAFAQTLPMRPESFNAVGALDYSIPLPISGLAAGPYLLRLDAAVDGATTRRDVRFQIQ